MQGLLPNLTMIRATGLMLTLLAPWASLSNACPALLYPSTDLPGLSGKRNHLQLFTWKPSLKKWVRLPVQTDLLTPTGGLSFDMKPGWESGQMTSHDRIIFDVKSFGKAVGETPLPCKGSALFRINDFNHPQRGAWLTNCDSKLKEETAPVVIFQPKEKRLYSQNYSYTFDQDNSMLFKSVFITKSTRRFLAAYHSDINIYSEIPKFFDLHFGSDSIESEISTIHHGPMGLNANVSFFVKILFLRLKLALSTDVSFYADSAHIPMVLYLPVNPREYLSNQSGIIYSWAKSEKLEQSKHEINMPVYSNYFSKTLKTQFDKLKTMGLRYCGNKDWCHFSLEIGFMNRPFTMQFSLPKELILKGFFPVYLKNPFEVFDDFQWEASPRYKQGQREGVFFPTMGLESGNSSWDFWLKLGGRKKGRGGLCPYPVTVAKAPPAPK